MNVFTELGTRIGRAWSTYRYESAVLPHIAADELEREPLHRAVDHRTILNWIATTDTLPYQMNIEATFGEPPLTVFWHPHFYIEALFWASATTTVHGHGFVGAFQMLAGTSLQSLFEFEAHESKSRTCRIGRLRQIDASLLRTGMTQKILAGERFIHSAFHLGYPTVTIVVRTHTRAAGQQYVYYRPGVAVSYNYESTFDQLTRRLLQVARLQALLKSNDLSATVARIGRNCELAASFKLLEIVQPILYGQGRTVAAAEVIAALVGTVGYEAARLAQALTLEGHLSRLRQARGVVVDDDLRLFLALLLTQQGRRFVMSTVTDYTGAAEPSHTIAVWIRELGTKGVLNVPTGAQTEALLKTWLESGQTAALQAASVDGDPQEVKGVIQRLQAEPLLAPLLRDDAF